MGMYTEFTINVKLKENLPEEVIEAINILKNRKLYEEDIKINHPIFDKTKEGRLGFIQIKKFNDNYLEVFGDLKNYWYTIEKFLNWLQPYINGQKDDKIGIYHYEEDDEEDILLGDFHFEFNNN